MKGGYLAAAVILAAYIGLEAFAASRARPRMEPDYIYAQMVEARVAVERCGGVPQEERTGFDAVMEGELGRLRRKLAAADPPPDPETVEAKVAALAEGAKRDAAAVLDAEGCEGRAAWELIRRHRIYGRKSR